MYDEYEHLCQGNSTPLFAVSRSGENIIVEKGEDEQGEFYLVTKLRRDGWHVRQKHYKTAQ